MTKWVLLCWDWVCTCGCVCWDVRMYAHVYLKRLKRHCSLRWKERSFSKQPPTWGKQEKWETCVSELHSHCKGVPVINGPLASLFLWIRGFLAEGTRPLKEVKHLVCFVMRSRNARSTLLIINKQDIVCHHHRMSFLPQRTDWGWRKSGTGLRTSPTNYCLRLPYACSDRFPSTGTARMPHTSLPQGPASTLLRGLAVGEKGKGTFIRRLPSSYFTIY